jgi:hypothetical protein
VTLHDDLIEQAEHLATRERKKPRQASLRRAVSTSYYALFHMLTCDAVLKLFPNTPSALRNYAQRAFAHVEMKNACEHFSKSPTKYSHLLVLPLEAELHHVAKTFVNLQAARYAADYDLVQSFDRITVLETIEKAKSAVSAWATVRQTPNANVFLTALLLGGRWNR